MKILVDCREIQKHITGIARVLLMLFKGIRNFNIDFDFVLLGNQHTNFNKEELKEYEKIVLSDKNTFYFDQIQILKVINEYKIDLFFSPYYKFPVFAKIPIVTSILDVMYLVLDNYKNFKSFYIKNFIKLTYNKVKKVITSSYYSKNSLIKILNLPEEKIEVIYLAVDDKFRPQSSQKINEIKQKYGIYRKYLLYVGNSKPHKNLNRLIEAYSLLPEKIKKEYQLVLVGVSKLQNVLNKALLYSNKFKTFNWELLTLSFVPDEDLPALYSGAEIFIFPSLYEGFGLPPLEAMACGCAVVASSVSSVPEVLRESVLYFDPLNIEDIKDKIMIAIFNKDLKGSLIEKGLLRASQFSINKMCKDFLSVFENIK